LKPKKKEKEDKLERGIAIYSTFNGKGHKLNL
jgi:hypothetical protein